MTMDLEELQQLHTRRRHLFRNNTSLSDCLHFALEDMLPLLDPWQTDDHLSAEAGDDGVIDQVAAVGSPDDPDAGVTPLPSHSASDRKGRISLHRSFESLNGSRPASAQSVHLDLSTPKSKSQVCAVACSISPVEKFLQRNPL